MSVCDTFPPGRAPSGDTQGDIAVACSAWQDGYPEDEARQPGTKEVIVTGRLAGTTTVFSTGAVQVDLNCAPLTEPGGDDEGGCSVGSGGNAVWPIGLLLIGFGVWRRRRV
jgi:MYXO-CTERM domain-containing protein